MVDLAHRRVQEQGCAIEEGSIIGVCSGDALSAQVKTRMNAIQAKRRIDCERAAGRWAFDCKLFAVG